MKRLIDLYRRRLSHYKPVDGPARAHATKTTLPRWPKSIVYEHILWMLDRMDEMLEQKGTCEENCQTMEKVNRWLGFIQGVLAATGVYSIDEMREQVIACR